MDDRERGRSLSAHDTMGEGEANPQDLSSLHWLDREEPGELKFSKIKKMTHQIPGMFEGQQMV